MKRMSILIQFVKDNMALFVFTIIAVVVLLCSIAGIITFHVMQKRLVKQDQASASSPPERERDRKLETAEAVSDTVVQPPEPVEQMSEQSVKGKAKADKVRSNKKTGEKHD